MAIMAAIGGPGRVGSGHRPRPSGKRVDPRRGGVRRETVTRLWVVSGARSGEANHAVRPMIGGRGGAVGGSDRPASSDVDNLSSPPARRPTFAGASVFTCA